MGNQPEILTTPFSLAGCAWNSLRKMQENGEFAHCQDDNNFGKARFKCKVKREQRNQVNSRGARCMCKNSRSNRNFAQIFFNNDDVIYCES